MIDRLPVLLGIALALAAATVRADAMPADEIRRLATDHLDALDALAPQESPLSPAHRMALIDLFRHIDTDLDDFKLHLNSGGEPLQFRTSTFARQVAEAMGVQTDKALRDLRARTVAQLEGLILELDRCRQAALADGEARHRDLQAARDDMAAILDAPEFQVERDRIDEVLELVESSLNRLYQWLGITGSRVESVSRQSLKAVLAASVGLISLMIGRSLWRRLRSRRRREAPHSRRLGSSVRLSSPERHARDATEAIQGGRYRDAIHHAYLMALAALERRQLVLIDRTRTNWEIHRQLIDRQAAGPADLLGRLNLQYDSKWYGHEAISEDEARAFARTAHQLVEEVGHETA
jgi:hypothetical protein